MIWETAKEYQVSDSVCIRSCPAKLVAIFNKLVFEGEVRKRQLVSLIIIKGEPGEKGLGKFHAKKEPQTKDQELVLSNEQVTNALQLQLLRSPIEKNT